MFGCTLCTQTYLLHCTALHSQSRMPMLSEKNHFSALGGPKVTIFGRDDLDPLYFDVSNISVTPDPPYMSKNTQMCYFQHFLGVPLKTYPQSRGPSWKLFIGNVANFFGGGLPYMLACWDYIISFSEHFVTVVTRVPRTFLELSKIQKNIS